jgi:phage-related holin
MNFEGLIKTFLNLSSLMWAMIKSPILAMSILTALVIQVSDTDRLAVETMIICFCFDAVLGVTIALKEKAFDWKKLPKLIYKAVVYFFYLKVAQLVGELLVQTGWRGGGTVFTTFLMIIVVVEARSVLLNGNKLYPNKVFQPLVALLDKISINNSEKLKGDENAN